jgi:imidazolonepropionase-like amidohydrolase
MLNRAAYFAIADECKKLGFPFVGHVPHSISLPEAITAGQRSIEHLHTLELYFFNKNNKPEELYQLFIDNDTWSCPTLTVHRGLAYRIERKELDKDHMVFFPKRLVDSWSHDKDPRFKDFSKNQWGMLQRIFENQKKYVSGMNKIGVRLLAGTDTSNPYCFAGFSLHDELALLVESGLTPMQALQASTRNAAEFMGKLKKMGTVEEGKIADLVLLRANPLDDIHNTTKIEAVIFDGHLYSRTDLDEMLEKAKRAAGN